MIPPRILDHGSVRIAWHEAVAVVDITVPDLPPLPPEVIPAGTKGWFRRTSRHRGTFLADGHDSGVQLLANDVEVSPVHVEVLYEIGEQPTPESKTKPKWRYHA